MSKSNKVLPNSEEKERMIRLSEKKDKTGPGA